MKGKEGEIGKSTSISGVRVEDGDRELGTHCSTLLRNHQFARWRSTASASTSLLPLMSASPKYAAPPIASGLFRYLCRARLGVSIRRQANTYRPTAADV